MPALILRTIPSLWLALALLATGSLHAQTAAGAFQPPDDIELRIADLISDGVRLQAEIFALGSVSGERRPTIIQAHGWGGNASQLRTDAIDLARAGYLVINFDYRGWGGSDGRIVPTSPLPQEREGPFTAQVREIRGIIDPIEQVADWFNVIHWAVGDPSVDPDRIGLRGTSFSGGHVVYVAAHEPRVKAIVSQVPATDIARGMPQMFEGTNEAATARARGEIAFPEPFVREHNLTGLPIQDRVVRYSPNDVAHRVRAPALFLVAEHEELFTNESQALLAYARVAGPAEYVVLPDISHYAVYGQARSEAVRLAVEWFDRHLAP